MTSCSRPAHRDPEVTAFLACWVFEELWHGDAIAAVLEAHGERGWRPEGGRPAPAAQAGRTPPVSTPICAPPPWPGTPSSPSTCRWGAVNEWTDPGRLRPPVQHRVPPGADRPPAADHEAGGPPHRLLRRRGQPPPGGQPGCPGPHPPRPDPFLAPGRLRRDARGRGGLLEYPPVQWAPTAGPRRPASTAGSTSCPASRDSTWLSRATDRLGRPPTPRLGLRGDRPRPGVSRSGRRAGLRGCPGCARGAPRSTRSSGWWASSGSPGPKLAAGTPWAQNVATSVQPTLARGGRPVPATRAASSGWSSDGGAPSASSIDLATRRRARPRATGRRAPPGHRRAAAPSRSGAKRWLTVSVARSGTTLPATPPSTATACSCSTYPQPSSDGRRPSHPATGREHRRQAVDGVAAR